MNPFKRFVIISMFLDFIALAVTGIVKFPELQRYLIFIYKYLPASRISMIHEFSGIILFLLIIIHLFLKRKGLNDAFNVRFKSPKKIYLIIFIVIIGAVTIFFISKRSSNNNPMDLPAIEIREYQGEKLGSIDDFRENSIKGPQYVDKKSYKLEIADLTGKTAAYSYDDILKLPAYQKLVTLNCVEGWSVKALWEGVLIKDLLKDITIDPEAKTVIFYAADGYSTSFPLDYVLKNDIIMADKLNGVVLPPERGFPFQLVAEQKWGYKWIRWITKIELSKDENYKGFWESRGYSNSGDLNESQFSQ